MAGGGQPVRVMVIVMGFQKRFQAAENHRPAIGDAAQHFGTGLEVFVGDGEATTSPNGSISTRPECLGTVALRERERHQRVAQWFFRNLGMSPGGNHQILLAAEFVGHWGCVARCG